MHFCTPLLFLNMFPLSLSPRKNSARTLVLLLILLVRNCTWQYNANGWWTAQRPHPLAARKVSVVLPRTQRASVVATVIMLSLSPLSLSTQTLPVSLILPILHDYLLDPIRAKPTVILEDDSDPLDDFSRLIELLVDHVPWYLRSRASKQQILQRKEGRMYRCESFATCSVLQHQRL